MLNKPLGTTKEIKWGLKNCDVNLDLEKCFVFENASFLTPYFLIFSPALFDVAVRTHSFV